MRRIDFGGVFTCLDGRVSTKSNFFDPSAIVSSRGFKSDENALRLDTRLANDDPSTLMTYAAGDIISDGPARTRPLRLGGV